MPEKSQPAPLDIPTLVAISAVAWIVFNELHTVVGHGGACVIWGDGLQAFTTTHVACSNTIASPLGARLYFAWGHVINAAAALLFFILLRFTRIDSPSIRYFVWISLCTNVFNIGNAMLVTIPFPGGDWYDFSVGLEPAWLWQGGLTLLGALIIVAGFRFGVQFWEPLIGGDATERSRRIRQLTWIACGTAFLTSALPCLLSPLVFQWGLLQALLAPVSVFWMLFLPLWRWGPHVAPLPEAIPLVRSQPWLVVAVFAVICFVIQAASIGTFPADLLR